mmetsp:Transcript_11193/g.17949  ORF Transcript_11193/g.17949 Transcript_11193/m.17949 type:complete len:457 (+) Transcript_11193:101-1471(+)
MKVQRAVLMLPILVITLAAPVIAFQRAGVMGLRRSYTHFKPIYRMVVQDPLTMAQDDVINPLVSGLTPSKTIEVHALTKALQAQGENIVSLCVGEPDFPPPQSVLDATIEAVKNLDVKYTAVTGSLPLRRAICADLSRRKGTDYAPEQVVVGNGAKQEVYQAVLALCRPGDEVVVPAPYWTSYPEIVKLAGATPVLVESSAEEEYLLTPEKLRAALTPRTRMIIFCNPSNPTGAVHEKQHLDALAEVLRKPENKDIWVLSDEIYERLVYDCEHVSFAALPGFKDRTIIVNGFSKSHAMTGYRLGYMAGPPAVVKAVTTVQGQLTSCASSLAQAAGVAALKVPDEELQESIDLMKKKRDFVMEKLRSLPGVKCPEPKGAFYVLPDISSYFGKRTPAGEIIKDDTAFCIYLLKEFKTAFVPGEGFGSKGTVRISYAASFEEIEAALNQFSACLASLED